MKEKINIKNTDVADACNENAFFDKMIEFKNVTKVYKNTGVKGADNLTFTVSKGEFVFITGSTGAGKTTAAKLILKEEEADSGSIRVNGTDVTRIKRRELPYYRRKIGMVFQDGRLISYKTVGDNILFALFACGVSKRNAYHMLPQILKLVGLEKKKDSYPEQLSGGELQKAAMARAMANNPPLLIADEPTGNLDPISSKEIIRLFERFNALGTTVVIISHDAKTVSDMKKRVIKIDEGRVIYDKSASEYVF